MLCAPSATTAYAAAASEGGQRVQMLSVPTMSRSMNMSEEQAHATWAKLEAAIEKIHQQNASSLSFEELYRYAYNMVLHRWAPMLYKGMEDSLRAHLSKVKDELNAYTDMAFMRQLLLKWTMYHKSTQLIRDILMARPPPVARTSPCLASRSMHRSTVKAVMAAATAVGHAHLKSVE